MRRRVHTLSPLLVVRDVERSAAFYCEVLGFEDPSFFGAPPVFGMIYRDGHEIMLKRSASEGDVTPNGLQDAWDVYLRVADVAAEKEGIERAGKALDWGPRDTPYQMREIAVLDPDGYRICFAQDMS